MLMDEDPMRMDEDSMRNQIRCSTRGMYTLTEGRPTGDWYKMPFWAAQAAVEEERPLFNALTGTHFNMPVQFLV